MKFLTELSGSPGLTRGCLSSFYSLKGESDHETSIALENLAIACEQAGKLSDTERHLNALLRILSERYGGGYNAKLFHLTVRLASVLLAQVGRYWLSGCDERSSSVFSRNERTKLVTCLSGA